MDTEPIGYTVGNATVRIITAVDAHALPLDGRVYTFSVTRDRMTTVYRADVEMRKILQKTDQQLAEYLVRHARPVTKLFSYDKP